MSAHAEQLVRPGGGEERPGSADRRCGLGQITSRRLGAHVNKSALSALQRDICWRSPGSLMTGGILLTYGAPDRSEIPEESKMFRLEYCDRWGKFPVLHGL